MKYMGSKSRIKSQIVPIIQSYITSNTSFYLEPFVGGANVIDSIESGRKIASDKHNFLIALYQHCLENELILPQHITREEYSNVRDDSRRTIRKYEDWYIGAVGFLSSYNGRWFDGGYSGKVEVKAGIIRDYYDEAKRNLTQQIPKLKGIEFNCCDYSYYTTENYSGGVIYCDIPYKDTKQYSTSKNFNHDKFWEWARNMSKTNIVLVSECQAPSDFVCIWEQSITRTVDNAKRVKSTEKIFVYQPNK